MTALSIVRKYPEATYMPLILKGVLAMHGLKQSELAKALRQHNGRAFSPASLSHLLNWNVWPKETPADTVRGQIERWLLDANVPREVVATIWNIDGRDALRNVQPVGIQAGRPHLRAVNKLDPDFDPIGETEMLSANAKKQFSIFRDPFIDDVQGAGDVFLSAEQRYIREAMFSTAKHGGFLAVIGESGAGKTVLRRDLIDRIQRDQQPIILVQPRLIDKGTLTASAICEAIIDDLRPGEKVRRSLEGKARQVEKLLIDSSRADNVHCLVIEEAHDLSISTLKFLKRFWELEDGFKKLLSILLIGQPELKNKLDERQHYEAREVIRRCEVAELVPLDRHLEEYLTLKLKRIGKNLGDLFDANAFDAMRARLTRNSRNGAGQSTSMVYPLVVNNLTTKALNLCAEIGAEKINADVIKEL